MDIKNRVAYVDVSILHFCLSSLTVGQNKLEPYVRFLYFYEEGQMKVPKGAYVGVGSWPRLQKLD